VAAATDTGGVRFTVSDTGAGFAEDQLSHLFERFTRSADSKGSGLGLSIAQDLIRAHGGTIRAWNQPDGGAAIAFTLPAA
jgi:two-component system sensor histidine kinase BaeS